MMMVESIGLDLRTSCWTSLARGVRPRHPLREVPVAGACEMRRSWGGVSLWDEALDGGAIEARGVGYPL